LYNAAAGLNNINAMMAFGRIYELGICVKPNPMYVFGSYERARKCGSMHGQWKVAELWEKNQLDFMQEHPNRQSVIFKFLNDAANIIEKETLFESNEPHYRIG
jgi:hypothetical protein